MDMRATMSMGSYRTRMSSELSKHAATQMRNDPREFMERPLRLTDVKKLCQPTMQRSFSETMPTLSPDHRRSTSLTTPNRARQYHPTKCNVSMRLVESEHEKGRGQEAYNMWLCPGALSPGHPWKGRARDTSLATVIKSKGGVGW